MARDENQSRNPSTTEVGGSTDAAILRQMADLADAISDQDDESISSIRDIASCLTLLSQVWPPSEDGDGEDCLTDSILTCNALSQDVDGVEQAGRFEIRRMLGHGGFGVVLLALDRRLGREVALKIPRPEALVSREMRQRFLRETQAAAVLDHPNIVPVYDGGEIGPICYLTTRYIAGPTLAEWLRNEPVPPSSRAAAELVATLADAVHHAHCRGILHRDLKPSNVLLEPLDQPSDGTLPFSPRLSDFGLAKQIGGDEQFTRHGALVGTPRYMAPEQAAGRHTEIGVHTDVYGLGVILYELLALRAPFLGVCDSETLSRIQTELPPAAPLRERRVPRDLQTICLKCLEKEQEKRYDSAGELAADLRRFLGGEPVRARPVSAVASLARWCRRKPILAGMSTALILVTVAGLIGISWQWLRAERNLAVARLETERAETNLKVIEKAMIDLTWASEEGGLLVAEDNSFSRELRTRLNRYADDIFANGAGNSSTPKPFLAALGSLAAKSLSLDGKSEAAETKYRESIKLWSELLRDDTGNTLFARGLAMSLFGYASHLMKSGRVPTDVPDFDVAQRTFADLSLSPQDELSARVEYAQLMTTLAYARARSANDKDVIRYFDLAARLWHNLYEHTPESRFALSEATMLSAMGKRQSNALRDYNRAIRTLTRGRKILDEVLDTVPVGPDRSDFTFTLGNMLAEEAFCRRCIGQSEAATKLYERSIATFKAVIDNEPTTSPQRAQLGEWYRSFADHTLEAQGPSTALARYQRSAEIWEALLRLNALSTRNLIALVGDHRRIGQCLQVQGNRADAEAAYRRSIEVAAPVLGTRAENRTLRATIADSYIQLGSLAETDGNLAEAMTCHQRAASLLRTQSHNDPTNPKWQQQLKASEAKIKEIQHAIADKESSSGQKPASG